MAIMWRFRSADLWIFSLVLWWIIDWNWKFKNRLSFSWLIWRRCFRLAFSCFLPLTSGFFSDLFPRSTTLFNLILCWSLIPLVFFDPGRFRPGAPMAFDPWSLSPVGLGSFYFYIFYISHGSKFFIPLNMYLPNNSFKVGSVIDLVC